MVRMCRLSALIVLLSWGLASLPGQEDSRLSGDAVLYGDEGTPSILLDSRRGWQPVAAMEWDASEFAVPADGVVRRWRLRTAYEHERAGGPATLQIRLRSGDATPVFTHPWSDETDLRSESYSNWFEDDGIVLDSGGPGLLEVRLIAPPRTPITGRLHSVVIEAWDSGVQRAGRPERRQDVHLAYASPLPTSPSSQGIAGSETARRQAALDFALSFVEDCLSGDLPAYYRAQAETVRSLDDGSALTRYRLDPPSPIPGVATLDDYRRKYAYRLYGAETYRELFPEWFDSSRPWTPAEDGSYLFMGQQGRDSRAATEDVDYLVFLVQQDKSGRWTVAARPGR